MSFSVVEWCEKELLKQCFYGGVLVASEIGVLHVSGPAFLLEEVRGDLERLYSSQQLSWHEADEWVDIVLEVSAPSGEVRAGLGQISRSSVGLVGWRWHSREQWERWEGE